MHPPNTYMLCTVSQNNYPETMGKFYIVSLRPPVSDACTDKLNFYPQINAPWAFKTVWGFVKPWLDEVTVSKIDILSSDYVKTLAQQIPLENLPKFLGGKCECPGGCTLSNAGPWQDKALVEKVLAKNKAAKSHANGGAAAPAAAPAAERSAPAPSVDAAAPPPTSAAPVPAPAPAVQQAAVQTPLPPAPAPAAAAPAPAIEKVQDEPSSTSHVKMMVVESKVDG